MVPVTEFLRFVDEALAAMTAIVEDLGDDLANSRPDVEGANTPYAILTHCLGVLDFWGGHVIAGRPVVRDRDGEFAARGRVADLVARARRARTRLHADLTGIDPTAPPRGAVGPGRPRRRDFATSQGVAALHLYTELAQHLGQMQVCRDVLRARWARRASPAP